MYIHVFIYLIHAVKTRLERGVSYRYSRTVIIIYILSSRVFYIEYKLVEKKICWRGLLR